MEQRYHEIYRGEVYYADMSTRYEGGTKTMQPVLVLLTDQRLYDTPTVTVTEMQRTGRKPANPTQVVLEGICGLPGNVMFQIENAYPIDKRRLHRRAGKLADRQMMVIDTALRAGFYLEDDDYLPMEVGAL